MNEIILGRGWQEGIFVERPNRFTLILQNEKGIFRAYLPNTGRIEEYCIDGGRFFAVPCRSEKFNHRIISTFYQGSYILLDTVRMNQVVQLLIENDKIPGLYRNVREHSAVVTNRFAVKEILKEKTFGKSRFDFLINRTENVPVILEVKTCTLCHNGVSLFPDAPSVRARTHIENLSSLRDRGFETSMTFIIPNPSARVFMPNFHTDPGFADAFLSERRVRFSSFSVRLVDPVTVDLNGSREVSIDYRKASLNNTNSGSYVIVLKNERRRNIEIGNLGRLYFPEGYYVYIGSGLHSLESRVKRHSRRRKKKFWHIDYITPEHMSVKKEYLIRRMDRIEPSLVRRLTSLCSRAIEGFGASDSSEPSHLLYFCTPPYRNGSFLNAIMDFRTFSE